jgi:hypothetical protein
MGYGMSAQNGRSRSAKSYGRMDRDVAGRNADAPYGDVVSQPSGD